MDKVFDREFDYGDFEKDFPEDLEGRSFHVCTVRQEKIGDLSVGSVFWLLKAVQARRKGAAVVVTDFYDKARSPNDGVERFMAKIGLLGDDVEFRCAEDVDRSVATWKLFVDYVRSHADEREAWQTIGTVDDGISKLLDENSDRDDVPDDLQRFLEELSVWVDSIDGGAVQAMNHEVETTAWVRRLYPEAKKEFWRVALPMINEFRGKYRETVDGEAVIHQRRLKDLADKLLIGVSEEQSQEHYDFYKSVYEDLIKNLCLTAEYSRDIGWEVVEDELYTLVSLAGMSPPLAVLYAKSFSVDFWRKLFDSSQCYSAKGRYAYACSYVLSAMEELMADVGRREIEESKSPSLNCLDEWLPYYFLFRGEFGKSAGKSNKLANVLIDDSFSMDDQLKFWHECAKSGVAGYMGLHGHPLTTKLMNSPDLPPDEWEKIKEYYLLIIPNGLIEVKCIQSVPVVAKVLDELFAESPNRFFELAFAGEPISSERVHSLVSGLEHYNKPRYRFLEYVVDRYLGLRGGMYTEIAKSINRLICSSSGAIPFDELPMDNIEIPAGFDDFGRPVTETVEVEEHPYAEYYDWDE